jgi:CheY-like chemotaxis protein
MSEGYVLIVDDHLDVQEMLASVLEMEGFETQRASDGQEALEKMAAQPPKLVVLDLMMPVMSGIEVLAHMQRSPETARIPVIVLSAESDQHVSRLEGHPNVREIMVKGRFHINALVERVKTHCG